jgi:4'-phosphopantetheinyl transferase
VALRISQVNKSCATAPVSSGELACGASPLELSVNTVSRFEAAPGVQVWYIPHDNAQSFDAVCSALTDADRQEFASIRHLPVRRRSLKTRAVLRRALSEAVDGRTAPHEWQFRRTEDGKPLLYPNSYNLSFSCSHTPWASVIAVSSVGAIGIDVAEAAFPASPDWIGDVLSPEELTALAELPDCERGSVLSRLWTLKEAYVKLLGIGIAEPTAVAFDLRNNRLISEHCHRMIATPDFRTWIVNSQGRRLSVALAVSGCRSDGVPSRRKPGGQSRVIPANEWASAC